MRLHSSSANFSRLGFLRPRKRLLSSAASHSPVSFRPSFRRSGRFNSHSNLKPLGSRGRKHGFCDWNTSVKVLAMDDDSVGVSSLDDFMGNEGIAEYGFSSSDGEDSDGEVILQPITDIDLPTKREQFRHDDALTVTAHRFAMLGRTRKKRRVKYGNLNNMGLMIFLTLLLLLVDWCAWRIVRLPLSPFYLMRPFSISAVLVSCTGYICVPLLRSMKVHSIFKKEGPVRHPLKKVTPTMGGLFLVPIGVIVAEVIVDFSSVEVSGAAAATLAFAAIGLVNDFLSLVKNENNGLSAWIRICLEVAVGMLFSFWFFTANVSSPYSMKWVVPLPAPLGLVYLGQWYLVLTSFCFVSMSNGINLTAGLDGLAGGTAALAFIGMSIAVLPICSDLSIFGASMAGACVGFLLHNRYKASIFMGDTGALALGGALAAMAACTGMFFPLFISSGILLLEALSVIVQVSFFRTTKYLMGSGRRFFQMAPFHHHLELCGFNEPIIVAGAYVISSVLALCAGYIGLISA